MKRPIETRNAEYLTPAGMPTGMTLVEMLVATAASLIIMAAVAQAFSVFGSAFSSSRSLIEVDSQLRTAAWKLRTDLDGLTARTIPPLNPTMGEGYLEVIEGPVRDSQAAANTSDLAADIDDILLFTTRSGGAAFRGKVGTTHVESPVAEVAWFLRQSAGSSGPVTYTLFRRQLLVVGYAGFGSFAPPNDNTATFTNWSSFYEANDLSVRRQGAVLIPNTLSDLTRRETRFMHNPNGITDGSGFPYMLTVSTPGVWFDPANGSTRAGEDVLLTNVLAFDIRVFDPAAAVVVSGADAVVPNDPGYPASPADSARGCYVDLGHGETMASMPSLFAFAGQGNYRGQALGLSGQTVWDTWSTHYEANGYDEDGVWGADQGTDGFDTDSDGQVDELDEQETSAPYPVPLRGIEVRIRVYEPTSRQVRQVTVRHTFVPH